MRIESVVWCCVVSCSLVAAARGTMCVDDCAALAVAPLGFCSRDVSRVMFDFVVSAGSRSESGVPPVSAETPDGRRSVGQSDGSGDWGKYGFFPGERQIFASQIFIHRGKFSRDFAKSGKPAPPAARHLLVRLRRGPGPGDLPPRATRSLRAFSSATARAAESEVA